MTDKTDKKCKEDKMHTSRCKVCKSDLRLQIEEEFISWDSPDMLGEKYPGIGRDSIYRHCKWAGLYSERGNNLEGVCDVIIERGKKALSNMDVRDMGMLKAVELKAKLSGKLKQNGDLNVNVGVQVGELEEARKKNMAQGLNAFGIKVESNRLIDIEVKEETG